MMNLTDLQITKFACHAVNILHNLLDANGRHSSYCHYQHHCTKPFSFSRLTRTQLK